MPFTVSKAPASKFFWWGLFAAKQSTKPTVTLAVPELEALNRACGAWILASSLGSLDLVEGESGSGSDVWDLVVMLNQFCEGF